MESNKKRFFVELLVAGSAVIISLCALLISYKQVNMMEEQMHLSVIPRISVGTSIEAGRFSMGLINNGIGPAEIKATEIRIDSICVKNWNEVFHRLDSTKTIPKNNTTSKLNDILVGQQKYWTLINISDSSWAEIFRKNRDRIYVKVCYKSLFDDWFEVTRNSMKVSGAVVNKKIEKNTIPHENRFFGSF